MLFFNVKKQRKVIPVDAVPTVLHFRPDYESSEIHQQVHNEIVQQSGCVRIRVKTWKEFVDTIRDERPDFITIHQSVIDLEHNSIEEFGAAVQSLIQYIPKRQYTETVPVAIGIDQDSTQQFVKQLQKAGFAGIWPSATAYGSSAGVVAMKVFFSNQEYWPQEIIDQLPCPKELPLSIYFRQDWQTYITPDVAEYLKQQAKFNIVYCTDWSELGQVLEQNPHQLIFHISMLERLDISISEIMSMLATKLKLAGLDIPVAVGIDPNVTQATIKQLKRAGVFGLVFSSAHWGVEETKQGMLALRDRNPYWPKHIIDQLPGNCPVVEKAVGSGIQLTARQREVMDLILI